MLYNNSPIFFFIKYKRLTKFIINPRVWKEQATKINPKHSYINMALGIVLRMIDTQDFQNIKKGITNKWGEIKN